MTKKETTKKTALKTVFSIHISNEFYTVRRVSVSQLDISLLLLQTSLKPLILHNGVFFFVTIHRADKESVVSCWNQNLQVIIRENMQKCAMS